MDGWFWICWRCSTSAGWVCGLFRLGHITDRLLNVACSVWRRLSAHTHWANEVPPQTSYVCSMTSQLRTSSDTLRSAALGLQFRRATSQLTVKTCLCIWRCSHSSPHVMKLPSEAGFNLLLLTLFVTVQTSKEPSGYNLDGRKIGFWLPVWTRLQSMNKKETV